MIPTKSNIAKMNEEKRKNKPRVHQKIANTFIENAILKNNISALKTLYYLSSVLSEVDMLNMKDDKIMGIRIDKREMLKFTELSSDTLRKTAHQMQETSISFLYHAEDGDEIIEGMSLLPRYKFIPNKNIIELDLYVRIAKMIVSVRTDYTNINIKNLMLIKSMHTLRMSALLSRISQYDENIPKRKKMTLEELNAFFGTNYKTWTRIEDKIIKPVQNELNELSKLTFIYDSNFDNLGRGRPKFRSITIDLIDNNGNLFTTNQT